MNRKIKFRAWHNEGGYMVTSDRGVYTALQHALNVSVSSGFSDINTSAKPLKYTLMQFTGLKDYNGKEIYEGDVLSSISTENFPYVVKFDNGEFCLYSKFGRWGSISNMHPTCDKLNIEINIIGNIFETPSFLKLLHNGWGLG